jgi:predicted dehydrogenase
MSVGVIGLGATGTQLARAFSELPTAELRWIADRSPATALRATRSFPQARLAGDVDELVEDETLDAVAIATPAVARSALVLRALERGKHVFVNAPMTLDARDCDMLLSASDASDRHLHSGHPVLFHPAVRRLRALVAAGDLGDLFYVRSCVRGAGGSVEGVLWEHGVPALVLVLALLGDEPIEVSCSGGSFVGESAPEIAFCHLLFATGIQAHVTLSSLEPHEAHVLTAVGSRRMAVFDALDSRRPLQLTELAAFESGAGDALVPRLPASDPVLAECEHFVATARARDAGWASRRIGASVVSVIEALQDSLEQGSASLPVGTLASAPPATPTERRPRLVPLPVRTA